MKFFTSMTAANRMIAIAVGLSIVSLAVAIGTIGYALSMSDRNAGGIGQMMPTVTLENTETSVAPQPPDISSFSGRISSVSATSLEVTAGDKSVQVRMLPSTEIYERGDDKDRAAFQKEMEAFLKTIRDDDPSNDSFFAPLPYETNSLMIADLKVGDFVMILADESQNRTAITITRGPAPTPVR